MTPEDDFVGSERRQPSHWMIDKKIPVALVIVIMLQTFGAIWWAATISGRVDGMEKSQATNSSLPERVIRLEVLAEQSRNYLDRIEKKIDNIRR